MESNTFINTKNVLTVICMAILVMLISLTASIILTPKFKSSSKLLVVFNDQSVDTYTASKTSNYIVGILSEVIFSESFVKNVYASNSNLKDTLGIDPEVRQKNWRQAVKIKILENKGIIMIDVYGNDKDQVNQLSNSIAYVLITKHSAYDGSGDKLSLKLIDSPVMFEGWTTIKVIRDSLIGLAAGFLIGLTFIIIFPQHRLFEGLSNLASRTVSHDETIRLNGDYYNAGVPGQEAENGYDQYVQPPNELENGPSDSWYDQNQTINKNDNLS